MTAKNEQIDFDDYADRYEDLIKEQRTFFSKGREYFSEYKAALAADLCSKAPVKILDFGCGVGLSLPFLAHYFPDAVLHATDLSAKSLIHVQDKFPKVIVLHDNELDNCLFDMVFVSGVFHHVPIDKRAKLVSRLAGLLNETGNLFVFEHNPFNPVTRRMVSTCAFDEDAVLITLGEMKQLMGNIDGFRVVVSGYSLFFPQFLQAFRPFEKALRWLPLGGQYFVVCAKQITDL